MPKVLVIARQFPPLGSVGGSVRIVKLMKFLSREGWSFDVITQNPDHPAVRVRERSDVLLKDLPENIAVHLVSAPFSLSDRIPDYSLLKNLAAFGWAIRAIVFGLRLSASKQFDLVNAAMPQMVNGLVAVLIARISGTKMALDIKDDVVGGSMYIFKSPLHQAVDRMIEKFIFHNSQIVTFVTQNSLEVYQKRYLKQQNNFYFIPNGCDLEEFFMIASYVKKPVEPFLIVTAASRYRSDYRDAAPFLRTYAEFLKSCPQAREDTMVIFLGESLSEEYFHLVDELELGSLVRNSPAVARLDYISWLMKANLLFLVQPYGNNNSTAGTLYEYWAAGSAPVLLISEKGSSRDLVEENHLGGGFSFDEIGQAAGYLKEVYEADRRSAPIQISRNGVEIFDRKSLALKMGKLWKAIIGIDNE
jgi:glycosyltransferase involved in cell wall biosynthesis